MTETTRFTAEDYEAMCAPYMVALLAATIGKETATDLVSMLRQAAETEWEREELVNSLGWHGLDDVSRRSDPSFESPSKTELVVSQSVGVGSPAMVAGNGTSPIHPTYYVRHPDGSYSVDDTLQAEVERLTKERDEARQIARRWAVAGYSTDAIIATWPKENA